MTTSRKAAIRRGWRRLRRWRASLLILVRPVGNAVFRLFAGGRWHWHVLLAGRLQSRGGGLGELVPDGGSSWHSGQRWHWCWSPLVLYRGLCDQPRVARNRLRALPADAVIVLGAGVNGE